MTPDKTTSTHLTEEELDEALLGTVSAANSLHLAVCAECRAQMEQFNSSMELFNQASAAWSEAKSNALNRDLKQHRTPFRLSLRAAWTCASVMFLLAGATIGVEVRRHSEDSMIAQAEHRRVPSAASPALEANAKNEIASDDAMLREIDAAINNAEPSPEQLYGISASSNSAVRDSHRAQVRD